VKELLVNCALKNLSPLKPRMELLEAEKEIVPGVRAIPAPGHTPGHIALVILSAKEQLLHMADTVLHPMHLEHLTWRTVFDLNQDDAASTRRRLTECCFDIGSSCCCSQYHVVQSASWPLTHVGCCAWQQRP
jgi:hypothetical protein